MATHSSILAWEIPWTEEPRLIGNSPLGHRRIGNDLEQQHIGMGKMTSLYSYDLS